MKNKKIVIALLIIFAVMVAFMGKTYAANSFSVSIDQENKNETIAKGAKFKVIIKLSKINVGNGLSVLSGTFKFSDDVLELSKSDVKGLNDWSPTYNPETKILEVDCQDPIKTDVEVCELTFKVKERTSANTASIQFSNIEGANADLTDPIKVSAQTVSVKIGDNTNPSPTTDPSGSEQPSQQPSGSEQPSQQPSNSQKPSGSNLPGTTDEDKNPPSSVPPANTTRSEQDIPKSGSEEYIIPLIIAIAALGLISFVNYKRID